MTISWTPEYATGCKYGCGECDDCIESHRICPYCQEPIVGFDAEVNEHYEKEHNDEPLPNR